MNSKTFLVITAFLAAGVSAHASLIYADSVFANPSCSPMDVAGPAYAWTSNYNLIQNQSPLDPSAVDAAVVQTELSAVLQSFGYLTSTAQNSSASLSISDLAVMFADSQLDVVGPLLLGVARIDMQTAVAGIIGEAFFAPLDFGSLADLSGDYAAEE